MTYEEVSLEESPHESKIHSALVKPSEDFEVEDPVDKDPDDLSIKLMRESFIWDEGREETKETKLDESSLNKSVVIDLGDKDVEFVGRKEIIDNNGNQLEKKLSSGSSCPSSGSSQPPFSNSSVNSSLVKSKIKSCSNYFGLLLALLSGVLMTAYSSMIKLLVDMDSQQVVIIRGILQLVMMGSLALYKGFKFTPPRSEVRTWVILFFIGLTGGLRLLFIFISYHRLPVGDVTSIIFSSPVFVMLFSIFVFREHCGVFRVLAAISLLSGVILISKPPILFKIAEGESYDFLGYGITFSACLMSALGAVLPKLITKKVEKPVILFYISIFTTICGTVSLFTVGEPGVPPAWEWGLSFAIAALGVVQQYLLIWAVQLEAPSRVTVMRQTQIVYSYAVQVLFFDVIPTWSSWLGAGLVLVTAMSITFEKLITEKFSRFFERFGGDQGINQTDEVEKEKEKVKNTDEVVNHSSEEILRNNG